MTEIIPYIDRKKPIASAFFSSISWFSVSKPYCVN